MFHSVKSRLMQIWAQPKSWPRFWTLEGPPRSNVEDSPADCSTSSGHDADAPPQLPRTAESERPASVEPIGYQSIDFMWCNTLNRCRSSRSSPLHGQTEKWTKTKRPREHGTNLKEFKLLGPPFLAYHEFHAYRRSNARDFVVRRRQLGYYGCGWGWALIITCYGAKWDQFWAVIRASQSQLNPTRCDRAHPG